MYEVTENSMRAGFAFGLLPGWWLSKSLTPQPSF